MEAMASLAPQSQAADTVGATLQGWAERELAPWRGQGLRRTQVERLLFTAAQRGDSLRLYRFAEGTVVLAPREAEWLANPRHEDRAQHYLTFFRTIAPRLPRGFNATICIGISDKVLARKMPIFGLQRHADETWLLMPDIDFLINDFHEDAPFRDTIAYPAKVARAVFAGATTGGKQTLERIAAGASPRLRAAAFFDGRLDVDFRLPSIVQTDDEATHDWLAAQPYCRRPVLNWAEQFHSRFMISMDGNGATCSRVAVALASNGVLLKYQSEEMLYYFDGLVPHVHYVPIASDQDVLDVLAAERMEPGRYLPVAEASRQFAALYLTRERAGEYMARLLTGYADMLGEGDAAGPRPPPRRVVAVARTADGAEHFSDTHDWVGAPDGAVALTSFKLLCQPRTEASRLFYQASTERGGFWATIGEGMWCGDHTPITGVRLLNPRDSGVLTIIIEARFMDGTVSAVAEMGRECRADSGSPIAAFRVRLA